nr:unnamed protein product [Callosobruchus analis]
MSLRTTLGMSRKKRERKTYLYLIQEVATRRNSTFYCLERFKLLPGYVGKILLSPSHKTAPPMVTPIASERLVSTLNNVGSDTRSRLTPTHTNELVFFNSLDYEYWNV